MAAGLPRPAVCTGHSAQQVRGWLTEGSTLANARRMQRDRIDLVRQTWHFAGASRLDRAEPIRHWDHQAAGQHGRDRRGDSSDDMCPANSPSGPYRYLSSARPMGRQATRSRVEKGA